MISQETKNKWKGQLETVLSSVEDKTLILDERENSIINSINFLLIRNRELSFRQSKALNRIYLKC